MVTSSGKMTPSELLELLLAFAINRLARKNAQTLRWYNAAGIGIEFGAVLMIEELSALILPPEIE